MTDNTEHKSTLQGVNLICDSGSFLEVDGTERTRDRLTFTDAENNPTYVLAWVNDGMYEDAEEIALRWNAYEDIEDLKAVKLLKAENEELKARIEVLETLQVKDVYLRTDGDFVVVEVSIGAASIELIREFVGQTGNTISHNYNIQHSGFPKLAEEAQAAIKEGSE